MDGLFGPPQARRILWAHSTCGATGGSMLSSLSARSTRPTDGTRRPLVPTCQSVTARRTVASRVRRRSLAWTATLVTIGALLSACTSAQSPTDAPSDSPASAATTSASPDPTSTLAAAEQQAVEEATEAVRAYEATFYEILADDSPRLNDLKDVATDPQFDIDLRNLQGILGAGETQVDATGPISIVQVETLSIDLDSDPPAVTLLVCVDSTAASGTEGGKPWSGPRQQMQYVVVKTEYLPPPGWAVSQVLPPPGAEGPVPC